MKRESHKQRNRRRNFRLSAAVCLACVFVAAAVWIRFTSPIADAQTVETNRYQPELVVQLGHTAQVHSVAVSPDGLTIASGSSDRTVKIWEAATGELLKTLTGHAGPIFAVAFSPDSQIVASGGRSGEIKLWNRKSGAVVATFHSVLVTVACLAFSPDGRILASGGDGSKIQFWDVQNKLEITGPAGYSGDPIELAFSPDGKMLAAVHSDLSVRLWNTENRTLIAKYPVLRSAGRSIAFDPDGKSMAAGDSQGNVELMDVATGRVRWSFVENVSAMNSLAFSPDGNTIAAGSDMGGIYFIDANSGKKIGACKDPETDALTASIAYFPDGRSVVAASFWKIKIWDAVIGEMRSSVPENSTSINAVEFSSRDDSFAIGSRAGGIKLFAVSGGELNTILPYQTTSWSVGFSPEQDELVDLTLARLSFSPDGRMLASEGSGVLKIWDVKTATDLRGLGKTLPTAFTFSPKGDSLAVGDNDGTVTIFDSANGREKETFGLFKDRVRSVSYSPDGRLLAAGNGKEVAIRDEVTHGETFRTPAVSAALVPALFGPTGQVLAVIADRGITIRDLADGKSSRIDVLAANIQTMAFSRNGAWLAVGTWEGDVALYEVASGREIRRFVGHSSNITSLAFDPADKLLLSGSSDGTAKLWRVDSGSEICSIVAVGSDDWVIVTPDGRFDTNKPLDNIEGLHWVMPDDPFRAVPLEIFMRQYYEPNLLKRLLKCNADREPGKPDPCDKEFKPLPPIAQINRVQPRLQTLRTTVPARPAAASASARQTGSKQFPRIPK